MLKFKGIPYLAFGSNSLFTSRHYEIEKTWYLKDGYKYPIVLKSYVFDQQDKYLNRYLNKIKNHPMNFKLIVTVFGDGGETLDEYEYTIGDKLPQGEDVYSILIVKDANNNYIGPPENVEHLFEYSELIPSASGKVISGGFNPEENKWYGWSHRAKFGFGIGDKIFISDYGDEHTLFNEHGTTTITTMQEAKQAAKNFSAYVS